MSSFLLSTCALGAGLGLRHALDSDHVAAITTMVTGGCSPRQAAAVGASWGLGHALVVVVFGAALLVAGVRVPAPLAVAFDLAVVGLMVGLGVKALKSEPGAGAPPPARALTIGLVHGVSGTAAVALLALTRAPSQAQGVGFLVAFSAAATLSMVLVSFLLAVPLSAVSRRSERLSRWARVASGLVSLAAAGLILVETVRGEGLPARLWGILSIERAKAAEERSHATTGEGEGRWLSDAGFARAFCL